MQSISEIKTLLEWHLQMGVDEVIGEQPINRLQTAPKDKAEAITTKTQHQAPDIATAPTPEISVSLAETVANAQRIAAAANTLQELKTAIEGFDGCSLKKTARNTVFADGAAQSDIMLIGEAPGADEDRSGMPFCGASGQLLDQMLASIHLSRADNCYLTNMLFWRPPGNRTPTPDEIAICRPFVERHIELFKPKLIVFVGAIAAQSLLNEQRGMMKLRGKALEYHHPDGTALPARMLLHPSHLLRQPLQKRLAWHDLLNIEAALN